MAIKTVKEYHAQCDLIQRRWRKLYESFLELKSDVKSILYSLKNDNITTSILNNENINDISCKFDNYLAISQEKYDLNDFSESEIKISILNKLLDHIESSIENTINKSNTSQVAIYESELENLINDILK